MPFVFSLKQSYPIFSIAPGFHQEIKFETDGDKITDTWKEVSGLELFKGHVEGGLEGCSEIAKEMGVSPGQVSKLAKRAEGEMWLRIVGEGNTRRYKQLK